MARVRSNALLAVAQAVSLSDLRYLMIAVDRSGRQRRRFPCMTYWYAQCMTSVQIAVRLPEDLIARLDDLVPGAHESRSQAVRRAIEVYLGWLANERDALIYERLPFTSAELAMADDTEAWAGTPAW